MAGLALLAAGCQADPPAEERLLPLFGTIVHVEVAGADAPTRGAALDALETLYRRLDRDWRAFGAGELGRVNERLAAGEPADLSPDLLPLVARALDLRERSGGLFDPRVGPLVALWGFQDMARETPTTPPDPARVAAARHAALDAAVLSLEGARLRASSPVRLDLAAVAKGSALAAGRAELLRHGVRDALVTIGGDVAALGRRGSRPWRVGVRDPRGPGLIGRLELADGEVAASSGTYERRFSASGRDYHHIIDPRTGQPARGAAGATVVGRDAELANAGATTLMVGGPAAFGELASRLGLDCALLVADDGALQMTPCMRQRLRRP